ncbi:MAG: hypothetical protein IJS74_03425 [Clostridia bacterium]|nr:hypothetical protein [Clostridia bacterium]
MKHNSPINFIYLIALALASVVVYVHSLYSALVFAVVVGMAFLVGLSIVSMIDKIADNHVRYIMYAFISTILITIIKVLLGYFEEPFLVFAAENMEFAVLPALILGIYPIYFENTLTTQNYFMQIILIAFTWVFFSALFGAITEFAGFGAIANKSLGFAGIEFFAQPYGAFFVIATIAMLLNIIRRAVIKHNRRVNNLVEKYKIIIKDIQDDEEMQQRIEQSQGGNK